MLILQGVPPLALSNKAEVGKTSYFEAKCVKHISSCCVPTSGRFHPILKNLLSPHFSRNPL